MHTLNSDLKGVWLGLNVANLSSSHDSVRPLSLIGTKESLLVVHALIEMLNELKSDDAVVGSTSLGEESLARLG